MRTVHAEELKDWLAMTDREAPEETRFGEKSYRGNERPGAWSWNLDGPDGGFDGFG